MDVSIVIVSWNTREVLRNCLNSIFAETNGIHFEIFVVDNNSADKSQEMVFQHFPNVKLIRNSTNRGFAAANNQAIRLATGRYILLLNPDTIILDNAITRCISYADRRTDIGALGCQVLEGDERIQRTGFAFPTPWRLFLIQSGLSRAFPQSRIFGRPELGWWDRNSDMELDVTSGMFMLVRREALEQVGLLDESYFVYTEEADWCYQLARKGWRRVFTTCARIVHLDGGSKSTSQVSTKMYVQIQKSMLIYFKKNLGIRSWLVGKVIYIGANLIRAIAWYLQSVPNHDALLRQRSFAALAALRFHVLGIEPL